MMAPAGEACLQYTGHLASSVLMLCTWLVLQELRQTLEEERKANDQLIDQTDRDRAKIDDLEGRCATQQLHSNSS